MNLEIHLRDLNPDLARAWSVAFAGLANVHVSAGQIFDVAADAVVSPANSFGFMDGGIDLVYSRHFGWELPQRLQARIRAEHDGELPVGEALIVETGDARIPYCVSAPTMRVPQDVSETVNAYLAFRAVLRAIRAHGGIRSLLCPGLGTAVGRMPPDRCARQMYAAYAVVALGQVWAPVSLGQAVDEHHRLLR